MKPQFSLSLWPSHMFPTSIPRRIWTHRYNALLLPRRNQSTVSPQSHSSKPRAPPLQGITVLDLTRVLAGPFCTQLLGDIGADVLKIEHPRGGDETRQWRTSGEGSFWHPSKGKTMSLYFAAVNRNKRSCTLDLKSVRGREVVLQLARKADVMINNFLPGTMERLGLGYEDLKKVNPGVVYASISGYGESGPMKKRAGYDAIALAEAGLLHITGEADRPPTKPGVAIADLCTGLYMYGSILAALRSRDMNGGEGCKVDGSLFESSLSLLINVGLASLNLEERRGERFGLGHPSLVPYGGFETADAGRYIFVAANNDRQWKLFCEKFGVEGLGEDERFSTNNGRIENRNEIDELLRTRFREKGFHKWLQEFEGSGLPYGAVNDVKEATESKQAQARGMVEELDFEAAQQQVLKIIGPAVKFEGFQKGTGRKPPLLGQHTEAVLVELGYDRREIAALRKDNMV